MPEGSCASTLQRIGGRLSDRLARAGMSQAELARQLDVTASTVGRYISGEIEMSVPTLINIARIVGFEPSDILRSDPGEAA